MKFVANLLSVIFHPLLIPSLITVALLVNYPFTYANNNLLAWLILGFTFVFTFLLPTATILLMKQLNFVSSVRLKNKEERKLPYLFSAAYFFSASYLFYKSDIIDLLYAKVIFIIGLCIVIVSLINTYFKISAHAIGVTGLMVILFRLSLFQGPKEIEWLFVISCVVAGAVSSSRLYLKEHEPIEVYYGIGVGVIVSLVSSFIILT